MPLKLLMCPPDYFGVEYIINPWMEGQVGKVDRALAIKQWRSFYQPVSQKANVELIYPNRHTPDMVFTANCGLVWNQSFIPSRFKNPERQSEEALFTQWFRERGFKIVSLPEGIAFEGAGDALVPPDKETLWMGHGFRTDAEAHLFLSEMLKTRIISLRLIHPHFYHLDTCFCPLHNGTVLYYPDAFDEISNHMIRHNATKAIPVSKEDAFKMACNTVLLEDTLFMNSASPILKKSLEAEGYTVCIQEVSEFIKAGGANRCLTFSWH
ncbi:MAG: hypothetical protein KC553_06505 [Nitrospina sp.]|nr:hypothetical protein [Nitrospina sp.]